MGFVGSGSPSGATDAFVVILSANSIKSSWVEKEVETAFERAYTSSLKFLLPIRLDDAVLKTNRAWRPISGDQSTSTIFLIGKTEHRIRKL
jgi:TIR domain